MIDDLIVYELDDGYLVVCNASNVAPISEWLRDRAPDDVAVRDRSAEHGMLALQGPAWDDAIRPLVGGDAVFGLAYFEIVRVPIAGVVCLVARTGYTGEPGVEIMCPVEGTAAIWDALMAGPAAPTPAGLAARDTLRMEMGYPLYGQELTLARTPVEAGLAWACDLDGDFVGAKAMRRQVSQGTAERLCIFTLDEPGIPRGGCGVLVDGAPAGEVTSGTLSPTLGVGIGMAYVRTDRAAPGTPIQIDIRGKRKAATIGTRPLVHTSPRKDQSSG